MLPKLKNRGFLHIFTLNKSFQTKYTGNEMTFCIKYMYCDGSFMYTILGPDDFICQNSNSPNKIPLLLSLDICYTGQCWSCDSNIVYTPVSHSFRDLGWIRFPLLPPNYLPQAKLVSAYLQNNVMSGVCFLLCFYYRVTSWELTTHTGNQTNTSNYLSVLANSSSRNKNFQFQRGQRASAQSFLGAVVWCDWCTRQCRDQKTAGCPVGCQTLYR